MKRIQSLLLSRYMVSGFIFLSGIFFVMLSISLFFQHRLLWIWIYIVTLFALGFYALSRFFLFLFKKEFLHQRKTLIYHSIFSLCIMTFIISYPQTYATLISLVFGWWVLFNALTRAFAYHFAKSDGLNTQYILFADAFVNLLIAMILIFDPWKNRAVLSMAVAAYLLLFGLVQVLRAIILLLPEDPTHPRKAIRVPLPIFIAAFIPKWSIRFVNQWMLSDTNYVSNYVSHKNHLDEIHVYFHMKENGADSLGHMDIGWRHKIYTYGNHDPAHRNKYLFWGDGVLIVADEDEYVEHAISRENKTLVRFTLLVNEIQRQCIDQRIQSLLNRTEPWVLPPQKKSMDYAQRIKHFTHASLYKFTKGRFKTYFAITTNCVGLVDYILAQSHMHLLQLNGVITPGTYFDFLNKEYNQPHSFVISRKVFKSI